MKLTHKIIATVIAATSLIAAGVVYAQPYAGMGPESGMGARFGMGHRMGQGQMMGQRGGASNPVAMVDSHLANLKAELKISPTQEAAWQSFTAKAKQQAEARQAMRDKWQQASGPALDRMNQRTEMLKQRTSNIEIMTATFKGIYAVLTPEQKAIADLRFGMPGQQRASFARPVR